MMMRLSLVAAVSALVLSTAAAHDVTTDAARISGAPDSTMSEAAVSAPPDSTTAEALLKVRALFSKRCVYCHGGARPADGLDLSIATDLAALTETAEVETDSIALVVPGAPESSYLVMKIKGADGIVGSRMPLAAKPLSEEDVAVVEEWIRSLAVPDTTAEPAAADSDPDTTAQPAAADPDSLKG
jgi:mono/diheme cytochrome c family protein